MLEPLRAALAGSGTEAAAGKEAILDAAGAGADWTMAAIVGCAGLRPTMAAIRGGHTVALANKEALVSAGHLMIEAAKSRGAELLPVDSEHNAIFQCFDRTRPEAVRRIILTASGGPFRDRSLDEMRSATPGEAIAHPNWSMGAKISVDCATLMNKGLELIEAFHLSRCPRTRSKSSSTRSRWSTASSNMSTAPSGSAGIPRHENPDRLYARLAERMATLANGSTWSRPEVSISPLPIRRFPPSGLAGSALREGGARPAVLNAANEVAVGAFLAGDIGFLDIASIAAETLQCYGPAAPGSVDEVLDVDREARAAAEAIVKRVMR